MIYPASNANPQKSRNIKCENTMKILQNIRSVALIFLLLLSVILTSCSEKTVYVVQTTPQSGSHEQLPEETYPPEITQKHQYEEPVPLDYTIPDLPEFVDNISECTDTEKQYVLPDGHIYRYQPIPSYSAVNQLALSTDESGEIFHGCGYQDNVRIRGVLEITEMPDCFVTGFIPISVGDTVYFSKKCFDPSYKEAHVMHTVFYDAEKKVVSSVSLREATDAVFEVLETKEDGYIYAIKLNEQEKSEQISYVRFSLYGFGENQIISINEELVPNYDTSAWVKTEKYLSEDWYQEIRNSVDTINNLDISNASNVTRFLFATDIHVPTDSTPTYTENLGKVSAEVMRRCRIPFFTTGGDNCSQAEEKDPHIFIENMEKVLAHLSPIPHQNILLTVGNHDGETGSCDYNGETVYYRYQLNNEERSAVFFDWQRESNQNKKFNSDGTYFYMDDPTSKTRFILLNSFWSQWEGDEDGFVPNIEHSFGHTPIFGPQQLKWFAEEALDMPPEYGAVIITHFAPDARDFHVFKGIVDAFSNQTTYAGSFKGVEDFQSTSIAVNYENAYGEIIAVFQGHMHVDTQYDFFQSVPCINMTTTGAYAAVRDENPPDRVKDTASEFAVDAVVIDRESRKIYLTRIGAGEDRVIEY